MTHQGLAIGSNPDIELKSITPVLQCQVERIQAILWHGAKKTRSSMAKQQRAAHPAILAAEGECPNVV
jgi:hypothetical protein